MGLQLFLKKEINSKFSKSEHRFNFLDYNVIEYEEKSYFLILKFTDDYPQVHPIVEVWNKKAILYEKETKTLNEISQKSTSFSTIIEEFHQICYSIPNRVISDGKEKIREVKKEKKK